MNMKNIDYPHPFLQEGSDDYVDCSFEIEINEEQTVIQGDNIVIAVNYILNCDGLNKLISDGTAKVIITAQSVALSYRQNFDFDNGTVNTYLKVPKDKVSNKIEIAGYVVAAAAIKSFALSEHNSDYYGSTSFNIRKGDVLAKSTQKYIDINSSELEKPLSSIFNISKEEGMDMMIYPVFEDNKIEIKMLPEAYDIYYPLRNYNNGSCRRALAGLVVLPVLTEAIDMIVGNLQCDEKDESMFDKRWYRAIDKKTREMNIDLETYNESSVSLASKLLGDVVCNALSAFKAIIDDESSGDEITRIGGED